MRGRCLPDLADLEDFFFLAAMGEPRVLVSNSGQYSLYYVFGWKEQGADGVQSVSQGVGDKKDILQSEILTAGGVVGYWLRNGVSVWTVDMSL